MRYTVGGSRVRAVETGQIREYGGSSVGEALYLEGASGVDYYYAHIRRIAARHQFVLAGEVVGEIVHHFNGDHLHLGANANIGAGYDGRGRVGSDDQKSRTWKKGAAIMRQIARSPMQP
ncbi:MAG: peptidoglycan DD-metalloendopeptidase family protein [Gaiella sp.]